MELAVVDVGRDFEEERAGIEDRQLFFRNTTSAQKCNL